jgi:hypothetical protein
LGLQNQPYLAAKQWQAQVSFQYGDTNDFFVGDQRVENPQPNGPTALFGTPPRRRVAIYDLDVFYGVSNRVSLDVTFPFLSGYSAVVQGTPANHQLYEYRAGGLGDITLQTEYWLNDPTKPSRIQGSVDVGIKMPTGADNITGSSPTGELPLDENTQLGNGGWEMLFRAQGSAQLGGPFFAYGSGYYGMSLTEHTEVAQGGKLNGVTVLRGVPDTYSGRLGAAYLLPWVDGLVFSAGGRINGVTVKDIVGGGDLYFRRPGYEVYFEPGLAWSLGGRTFASVSVPIRVYQKKLDSLLDQAQGVQRGSDFAAFLVVASVGRRF